MSEALNIFDVLKAINTKNVKYYDGLTEQEQKGFVPFLVMRWLSGTSNQGQVYIINEIANPYMFTLGYHHKKLMFQLLTICTTGKFQKNIWNPLPGKKRTNKPVSSSIVAQYYNYSIKDANEALVLLTVDNVLEYAESLGCQPDEISKIKKEMKVS